VLDNIRVSKASLPLTAGVNEITIGALEAGLVLEKLVIYTKAPPESYLGPPECSFTPPSAP
jgi:hypothetical protein